MPLPPSPPKHTERDLDKSLQVRNIQRLFTPLNGFFSRLSSSLHEFLTMPPAAVFRLLEGQKFSLEHLVEDVRSTRRSIGDLFAVLHIDADEKKPKRKNAKLIARSNSNKQMLINLRSGMTGCRNTIATLVEDHDLLLLKNEMLKKKKGKIVLDKLKQMDLLLKIFESGDRKTIELLMKEFQSPNDDSAPFSSVDTQMPRIVPVKDIYSLKDSAISSVDRLDGEMNTLIEAGRPIKQVKNRFQQIAKDALKRKAERDTQAKTNEESKQNSIRKAEEDKRAKIEELNKKKGPASQHVLKLKYAVKVAIEVKIIAHAIANYIENDKEHRGILFDELLAFLNEGRRGKRKLATEALEETLDRLKNKLKFNAIALLGDLSHGGNSPIYYEWDCSGVNE